MAFLLPKPATVNIAGAEGHALVPGATHHAERVSFEPTRTRPSPRSQRIPDSVWERYREEISSLYRRSTLKDVMNHMHNKYNFPAS